MYNYSICVTHNEITNETIYEAFHKKKLMRYEILFGKDSYIECIYFFSRYNGSHSSEFKDRLHRLRLSFLFYSGLKHFENNMFNYLFNRQCQII